MANDYNKTNPVTLLRSFTRDTSFPLDSTCLFGSMKEAEDYINADDTQAYPTQIVGVVNEANQIAEIYMVDYKKRGILYYADSYLGSGTAQVKTAAYAFDTEDLLNDALASVSNKYVPDNILYCGSIAYRVLAVSAAGVLTVEEVPVFSTTDDIDLYVISDVSATLNQVMALIESGGTTAKLYQVYAKTNVVKPIHPFKLRKLS
jgi:hypothetical protein